MSLINDDGRVATEEEVLGGPKGGGGGGERRRERRGERVSRIDDICHMTILHYHMTW